MSEHAADLVQILWYILGGIVAMSLGVFGWFLKREVKMLDDRQIKVEAGLVDVEREISSLKGNYLSRFQLVRDDFASMKLEMMDKLHRIELLVIQKNNNHDRGME